MRVLICGSRTYEEQNYDFDFIGTFVEGLAHNYHKFGSPVTVIHGAAEGADTVADECAEASELPTKSYAADWDNCTWRCRPGHRRKRQDGTTYCPSAGPRRNRQMLEEGQPDVVIAFVDKPLEESSGTNNMVELASAAGVTTFVVERVHR